MSRRGGAIPRSEPRDCLSAPKTIPWMEGGGGLASLPCRSLRWMLAYPHSRFYLFIFGFVLVLGFAFILALVPFSLSSSLPHSEELRRRFVKAETMLFRLRFETDDAMERELFLRTLNFDWEPVSAEEKMQYREQLLAASPKLAANFESESFFKVSGEPIRYSDTFCEDKLTYAYLWSRSLRPASQVQWTRVTDLVEKRRVFLKAGTAWVPLREQASLVLAEFQSRLSKDLEVRAPVHSREKACARARS